MPSKSKKQHNLMAAAAHNKEFADRVGVPQEVAREFIEEDKKKEGKSKTQDQNKEKASQTKKSVMQKAFENKPTK